MSNVEPEKENSFFVSRRGRQVGMNQVDLSDINIDADTAADTTPAQPSSPQKKPSPKQSPASKGMKSWMRKKTTIIIAVLVILVLIPLVVGEVVAAQYRSGVTGAKSDLAKLVSGSVLPMQKNTTVSADQIRTTAVKVNDIATNMCRGGLLDNMAGLYPRAQSVFDDCKSTQTKYASLVSGLYELETQARYLERLSALVKPISTPITDEYAVIDAQHIAWKTASDGLKELSPPTSMAAAHKALLAHVSATAENWSKLNTANNAQDGAAFTEAEKALASEYEAVRATSPEFTKILSETQTKVTASYNVLK